MHTTFCCEFLYAIRLDTERLMCTTSMIRIILIRTLDQGSVAAPSSTAGFHRVYFRSHTFAA